MLRVDELEREKEEMRRHYDAQIKTMREAMKEQLSVSKEAVSTINSLRRELAATQAESRKLHSELRDSKVILAPPAGTSSKPAGPVAYTDTADSLTARIARLEQQISGKIGEQPAASTSGPPKPSAPPIPPQDWSFSRPLQNAPPPHQEMHFQIRPREPPMFSGEKGQDVMVWLRQVDDYLALVNYTEKQAVAYLILLLTGNARCWWDAEFISRGSHRPDTVEELKMLLKAQFESPVRETRARVELIHLGQKKGENASTYMARTKTLLHKVPGYDLKTALQQWVLGLRQPYRLEAAKASPQTLAEAERLVARLEDAMEFARAGKDESGTGKASGGDQKKDQKGQKCREIWRDIGNCTTARATPRGRQVFQGE